MPDKPREAPAPATAPEQLRSLNPADRDAILTTLLARMKSTGDKAATDELVESNYDNYDDVLQKLSSRLAQRGDVETRVKSASEYALGLAGASIARAGWAEKSAVTDRKTAIEYVAEYTGAEKSLSISVPEAGGLLVTGDQVDDFFAPLRNEAVVLSMNPVTRTIVDGSISVTGLETDVSITWDGEIGTQEVASEPSWGERDRPSNFARVIVPISNKALRSRASTQVIRDVTDSYRHAFSIGFDQKFINGTGVSYGPKGLRAYAPASTVSAGTTFDLVTDDFKGSLSRMSQNSVPMRRLGWLMSKRSFVHLWFLRDSNSRMPYRDELNNGTLFGIPVGSTNEIATNEGGGSNETFNLLVDFSGVLIGIGDQLQITQSDSASYNVAATTRSAFERDETLTRVVGETLLLVAQPAFIDEVDTITWGA